MDRPDAVVDLSLITYERVDLHYHAGFERQPWTSMEDYLAFAESTGRKLLGVTDHFGYYVPGKDRGPRPYPGTLEGFLTFADDIRAAARGRTGFRAFVAPELGAASLVPGVPIEAVNRSDFFLCEPPGLEPEDVATNTEGVLRHIAEAADFREKTSKPVVLAHPFRAAINWRLVKGPIEPWLTNMPPRPRLDFSYEELTRFLMMDIPRFADACKKHSMPVEVNGETDLRIRRTNLLPPRQMLMATYLLLRDAGIDLVPGSDLHGISSSVGKGGSYVPADIFAFLGLSPAGSDFLRALCGH